ncbi:MAG: UDP-N-acetylglucosamine 2-epimerase (non-hydrolyzing) [Taibaiella sp.]|nr:UDP-N-acetylglucosamine 2-epimerase (non-hydrolyzing) [Taibaiella sp.]
MKILTVVGARPQFVKAAVVSRAFVRHRPDVHEVLVHTGQHYDANMSDVFFDELDIPRPSFNLGIGGGTHGQNTGRMLEQLEGLMISERPDWVLVYGDTDSTLSGALAASKLHIPLAHVEAGLRSYNRNMPEEINRLLTDHISTVLFAPTVVAQQNLTREGVSSDAIRVVGDVMHDAALYYKERARQPIWFDALNIDEFALCTIHRAENTDSQLRMQNIMNGLGNADVPVILPLHPRTRKNIVSMMISLPENIHTVDPVGYLEMVWLESRCKVIATDSGGVQKEAYFHQKQCVTLRDETEWMELVSGGFNVLVGANSDKISRAINDPFPRSYGDALYGDGNSALLIVESI